MWEYLIHWREIYLRTSSMSAVCLLFSLVQIRSAEYFVMNILMFCRMFSELIFSDPPISPIIRGVGDKIKVRAGDSDFRLACTSEGGNPAPRLTWFRNNIQAESTDVATSGGEVTSILTFVPRITDNNAVLTCEAVNQLMPRGLSVQTSLIVQCKQWLSFLVLSL